MTLKLRVCVMKSISQRNPNLPLRATVVSVATSCRGVFDVHVMAEAVDQVIV